MGEGDRRLVIEYTRGHNLTEIERRALAFLDRVAMDGGAQIYLTQLFEMLGLGTERLLVSRDLAQSTTYGGQFETAQGGMLPVLGRLLLLALNHNMIVKMDGEWQWNPTTPVKKIPVEIVISYNEYDSSSLLPKILEEHPGLVHLLTALSRYFAIHYHGPIAADSWKIMPEYVKFITQLHMPFNGIKNDMDPTLLVVHASHHEIVDANAVAKLLWRAIYSSYRRNLHTIELAIENSYMDDDKKQYSTVAEFMKIISELLVLRNRNRKQYLKNATWALTLDLAHFACAGDFPASAAAQICTHLDNLFDRFDWKPSQIIVHLSQNKTPAAGKKMTDDHLPHLHGDAVSTATSAVPGELQETPTDFSAPIRSVAAKEGLDLAPAVGRLREYCLEKDIPCVVVTEQTGRVDQQDIAIASAGLPSA